MVVGGPLQVRCAGFAGPVFARVHGFGPGKWGFLALGAEPPGRVLRLCHLGLRPPRGANGDGEGEEVKRGPESLGQGAGNLDRKR